MAQVKEHLPNEKSHEFKRKQRYNYWIFTTVRKEVQVVE
jgi:hypothetical protein